jgi:hypothetical protein
MRRLLTTVLVVGALFCVAACSRKTDDTAIRAKVANLLSKTPFTPAPQHPLDVQFGDSISLIGYDVDTEKAEAGKPVHITWYYKVNKSPGADWMQFTHIADGKNVSRINLDHNGPLRQGWTAGHWEAGSYVKDPQTITLPSDWDSDKLVVFLGFWKANERLDVTKGPKDDEKRARPLELQVKGAEPESLPELTSQQALSAIKLDGKLDEPVWSEAQSSNALVNTMNGSPAEPNVRVKSAWDEKNLYVAFDVKDDLLKSKFTSDDDHLWEQDCVEIMLDPDGDGKNYFELQVSPRNKHFDTRYDSRRKPQPFGHVDWNAGMVTGVEVKGTVDDDKADTGYVAEIAIPWSAFAKGEPAHQAPKAGDSWRVNFYVMDARNDDMRAVGWSPPKVGDFHVPKRFGKLNFSGSSVLPAVAAGEKPAAEKVAAEKSEKKGEKPVKAEKKKPEASKAKAAPATP